MYPFCPTPIFKHKINKRLPTLIFLVISGMLFIADLHTHSHYAGATSKFLCLETMYQWALIKGIDVVGTGDFTHPA
jgi:hypothetical protein